MYENHRQHFRNQLVIKYCEYKKVQEAERIKKRKKLKKVLLAA